MIRKLPIEWDEHGGFCSLIRDNISYTGLGEKMSREISINDLPEDTNPRPAEYNAGFLSTTLKYCGGTKGLIGIEIG